MNRATKVVPVLTLLSVACVPNITDVEPANGKIAFMTSEQLGPIPYDVRQTLHLMEPDGSQITDFVSGRPGALYGRGSWSPDGGRFVVPMARTNHGLLSMLVVRPDGAEARRVLSCPGTNCGWSPAWAPDGASIAFVDGLNLFTMTPWGWVSGQLTHCNPPRGNDRPDSTCYILEGAPAWSPDSTQLAFARSTFGGTGGLFVIDSDGTELRRLTRCHTDLCVGGFREADPAWSPDGAWIAFTRERNIWAIRPDGSGLHRLTRCPPIERASQAVCTASQPTWAPDGTKLAFEMQRGRDTRIWVMDPRGRGARPVGPAGSFLPVWQPAPSPS